MSAVDDVESIDTTRRSEHTTDNERDDSEKTGRGLLCKCQATGGQRTHSINAA